MGQNADQPRSMQKSAWEAVRTTLDLNDDLLAEAKALAEREGVDVRTYRVIYRAIEDVRDALVGLLEPDIVEEPLGALEVRATFKASRLGTIAGGPVVGTAIER